MSNEAVTNEAMTNKTRMDHRGSNSMGNRGNSSNTVVGHISNIAINIVGVVVDSLDAAVREVDRVGAIHNTSAIVRLRLAEGSTRVLISNSIVVGVGGDLGQVRVGIAHSMGHRVSHSMNKRSSMGNHRVGYSMAQANTMSQ